MSVEKIKGRENWEFDRIPGSSEIVGSKELTVTASVRGKCNMCGFNKKINLKQAVGYSLYANGTDAKEFAILNGKNVLISILKTDLATEHIVQKSCRNRLIYK